MKAFGLKPSRLIGDIKRALEEAITKGEIAPHQECEAYVEIVGKDCGAVRAAARSSPAPLLSLDPVLDRRNRLRERAVLVQARPAVARPQEAAAAVRREPLQHSERAKARLRRSRAEGSPSLSRTSRPSGDPSRSEGRG